MDNTVGQEDSRGNVAEEEEVTSEKIERENAEEGKVVGGGGKEDSMVGNTDALIAETASTQNGAIEGDTNQPSAEVSEKTDNPPEPLRPQQSNNIPVSLKSEAVIVDPAQTIPASTSNPYKPNTMFFKPENHIASDSHSHTLYSDTNIDPKNLAEISEDGMLALRLTETERTSPLMSPSPVEPLSPSTDASNIITPKQVVRIERDYSRGELCQFQVAFPMEIDGRINPRRFQQTIDTLNEMLGKAFNPRYNWFDNCLACVTIYTSTFCIRSHYERMIEEICIFLDSENQTLYNQNGLNFRNPQRAAFLFLELELY